MASSRPSWETPPIDAPNTDKPRAEPPTWRWLVFLVVVGVVAGMLRSDALSVGLMGDDFIQHAMLSGLYPGEGYVPFDLYAFVRGDPALHQQLIELGAAPWWSVVEGDPGAERGTMLFAVLRPLSSLLLTLDHTLFPDSVYTWHLHSLLWFIAAIVAVGLALRRIFAPTIAAVAVVLFALDPAPLVPLAWLANRCALVAACFGALALWAHVSRRGAQPGPRQTRLLVIEIVCVCMALGGGEYGLVAVCYLVGWELAGPPADGLQARAVSLAPSLVPALVYLVIHQLGGYGIFGETYIDVFEAPGDWLRAAIPRLFNLVTGACWSVPAGTSSSEAGVDWLVAHQVPSATMWAFFKIFAGSVAVFGLGAWFASAGLSVDERRALRGLVLGALLGVLPLTAAPAQARLLIVTELGASALIAAVIVGAGRLLLGRAPEPRGWPRRLLSLPIALALLYSHTIGDLRAGQAALGDVRALEQSNLAAFSKGDLLSLEPAELQGRDVIIVNSLNLAIGLQGGYLLHANGWPAPRSWRPLAMGAQAMTATRLGPKLIELRTVQGTWLTTPYELQPMSAGEVYERPGLRAEIIEAPNGQPTRVQLRFEADLEDARYLFVTMTPTGLRLWTPPEQLKSALVPRPRLPKLEPGASVELPRP